MSEATGSVHGSHDTHQTIFYGLSTCQWCKKTRKFPEDPTASFDFVYVDKLTGQERARAIEQVRGWNSSVSFPTVVIDNDQCVVGYKPEKLKEVLGL
jgi:glutaredoxin-like protein NrdH